MPSAVYGENLFFAQTIIPSNRSPSNRCGIQSPERATLRTPLPPPAPRNRGAPASRSGGAEGIAVFVAPSRLTPPSKYSRLRYESELENIASLKDKQAMELLDLLIGALLLGLIGAAIGQSRGRPDAGFL